MRRIGLLILYKLDSVTALPHDVDAFGEQFLIVAHSHS